MVYPSGEVETGTRGVVSLNDNTGSGWFIHPGKLKRRVRTWSFLVMYGFRMVYPSGEVETPKASKPQRPALHAFRMVYPSGEVETNAERKGYPQPAGRSGWFIHPGKLKPGGVSRAAHFREPRKIKKTVDLGMISAIIG